MAKWTLDLNVYAERQIKKIASIKRKLLFSLYNSITTRTPVDTGRARGNWNVSKGQSDTSTNENQKTPQYYSLEQMPNTNDDESLFISNGLDYIEGLEYGKSKQAPNGMVGITLMDKDRILDNIIRSEYD